jgi:nucleoid-associated protein YejK
MILFVKPDHELSEFAAEQLSIRLLNYSKVNIYNTAGKKMLAAHGLEKKAEKYVPILITDTGKKVSGYFNICKYLKGRDNNGGGA